MGLFCMTHETLSLREVAPRDGEQPTEPAHLPPSAEPSRLPWLQTFLKGDCSLG